jgi:hypothetical protein
MARASAGARSVVTSVGAPWTPIALAKKREAAFVSRLFDTNTSMTWPGTVALSAVDDDPASGSALDERRNLVFHVFTGHFTTII